MPGLNATLAIFPAMRGGSGRVWAGIALIAALGCASGGGDQDAGRADAGPRRDAGREDAGPPTQQDAGPPSQDAGPPEDAGPPFDAGPGPDAGPRPDAGPGGGCSADPATVTISEIMISSQSGSGDRGEWFELRNEMPCTVSLAGVDIVSGGVTHTIAAATLTAGGYLVLAQSADAGENHGLTPDYVYGPSLSFGNGGGSLSLENGGTEIARVSWGSTDYRRSASRQLSAGARETEALSDARWCDSTAVYSMATGGPFNGTPGMANAACP